MTNAKDSTVDLSHLYPELLFVPSERYEKFYRDRYEAQKKKLRTFTVMATSFHLILTLT